MAMHAQLRPLTRTMISDDAAIMYPCFHARDVEAALLRMTSRLGFHRVDGFDLPHVYTYEADDLRLVVMATPRVYREDRMCYALSGVLIRSDAWVSDVEMVPRPSFGQKTSTWRKHPKAFYMDLIEAMKRLQPDRCLPAFEPRLLGPAPEAERVRRIRCLPWGEPSLN